MKKIGVVATLLILAACENNSPSSSTDSIVQPMPQVQTMSYTVINVFPHDTTAFTQGLLFHNNELYEGTGMYKESKLKKVDVSTGKTLQQTALDPKYFGEGITILNNKIYQLTWQDHKVFVYDLQFKRLPQVYDWPYEGWGITTDGSQLIISTGGNSLYFVDPKEKELKIVRSVGVADNNGYVENINELEWVDGFIYANKYLTDQILKIDPTSGQVVGRADLTGIMGKNNIAPAVRSDVLNGIAYHPVKKTFFITGKYWPAMFEVRFQ
ncbi:MAG: glutaminyl-peptide cyclotransferase [Bacteroidota bacterium]|jgi:glutamine cyclotransferase